MKLTSTKWLRIVLIVAIIALFLVWYQYQRIQLRQICCRVNLSMIEAGKDQWAQDKGKTNGDIPKWEDLIPKYLEPRQCRYNLKCPCGGEYIINPVGQNAACTYTEPIYNIQYRTRFYHSLDAFKHPFLKE